MEIHDDPNNYTWKSGDITTSIFGGDRDDLQIRQTSGDSTDSLNAHYDYWLTLIGLTLKYADTVDAEIPEAENWREFLSSYGWAGAIISSREGYHDFPFHYSEREIAQLPDKIDSREIELYPPIFSENHQYHWFPVIDEQERLVFYANFGKKGEESIMLGIGQREPKEYYPGICIPKENAEDLFKGAVHAIMRGQTRTHPEYLAFLLWQQDQLKQGKDVMTVQKESHQFD